MMNVNKDELINEYFPIALEETIKVVSIPSFRKNLEKGTPVDPDIKKVLNYVIDLCKGFGWKTFTHPDGLYGYADIGDGEKLFGIICHLDVVPPGDIEQWKTNPFECVIKDGKLIGRGAFDDKGPSMMNIYAMKYLLDKGFKPDYTVRFIFGTSEETTWECMEAYVANERICDLGYVPDAEFPVVYAEKWICDLDLKGEFNSEFELKGGEVYNAVCDVVTYSGPKKDEIQKFLTDNKIFNQVKEDKLIIKGTASHGSLPEKGVSASIWAAKAINEVGIKHPLTDFLAKYAHLNYQMEEIFGDISDETGMLTACNGMIDIKTKDFSATFNYRVPCTRDPQKDVVDKLTDFLAKSNIKLEVAAIENSVYFPKDGEVVKSIMSVYQEVTGDYESQPVAIGGGTFAKSMPNMIAFGAEFNIEESTMHAYNEYVKIEDLKKMMEIYAKSIAKLTIINK